MGSGADLNVPTVGANLLSEVVFSSLLEWQKCADEYRMRFWCSCFVCMCPEIRVVIRVVIFLKFM